MRSRCPVFLLIYFLLGFCAQLVAGFRNAINASFIPPYIDKLKEDQNQTVIVLISFESELLNPNKGGYSLRIESQHPEIADVFDSAHMLTEINDSDLDYVYFNTSFTVQGAFIGKTRLSLSLIQANTTLSSIAEQYRVWILRGSRTLTVIFISTLGCLIIIANVLMGCELNLEVVKEVLKKPIAPIIGFVCQFALMPLISYIIALVVLIPPGLHSLGLGLFTAGCSPGGGASNFWTLLLNGNTDLSVTMTFISTVAALGMMPFWMWLLGQRFLIDIEGAHLTIPYKDIVMYLMMLIGPLVVGIGIRRCKPEIAEKMRKALRPFIIFIIIFIITFGVYANLYMFRLMSWRVLMAGLLLPWFGFMFGCFAAVLSRQPSQNVTAIAIETGIQNSGVAIMLLKVSFDQPDADLSSVIPVVVSIFTPIPLLFGYCIHHLVRCIRGTDDKESEASTASSGYSKAIELDKSLKNCNTKVVEQHTMSDNYV